MSSLVLGAVGTVIGGQMSLFGLSPAGLGGMIGSTVGGCIGNALFGSDGAP